jgi:hypothetical protein
MSAFTANLINAAPPASTRSHLHPLANTESPSSVRSTPRPATTTSPLTEPSHPSSFTMNSSDDHTSGTIVSNLFTTVAGCEAFASSLNMVPSAGGETIVSSLKENPSAAGGASDPLSNEIPSAAFAVLRSHTPAAESHGNVSELAEQLYAEQLYAEVTTKSPHIIFHGMVGKMKPNTVVKRVLALYSNGDLAFYKDTSFKTRKGDYIEYPTYTVSKVGHSRIVIASGKDVFELDTIIVTADTWVSAITDCVSAVQPVTAAAAAAVSAVQPVAAVAVADPLSYWLQLLAECPDDVAAETAVPDAPPSAAAVAAAAAAVAAADAAKQTPAAVTRESLQLPLPADNDVVLPTLTRAQLARQQGEPLALGVPTLTRAQSALVARSSVQLSPHEAIVQYALMAGATDIPENPTADNALAFARNMSVVAVPRQSIMPVVASKVEAAQRDDARDKYAALLNYLSTSTDRGIAALVLDPRIMAQLKSYANERTTLRSVMADKAKTMKCAHTFLLGEAKCPFASSCTFAHSEKELRPDLANLMNIVVNSLLATNKIDIQTVIEGLVAHFVRDDIIDLVDNVFACLDRYAQVKQVTNPQKPLSGIYVDENCLARMRYEHDHPRTDPNRGLKKEYLPHLLTLHKTLVTFLTHPDLAQARSDYSHIYDFTSSLTVLGDMKDSNGLILRDISGFAVTDIVEAVLWGYDQCPKNRQFPHHEMAYVAITMPSVRNVYTKLHPKCKKIVEDAFSLTDYCMGGTFGCSHGGHTNYTRRNENGVVTETLLNMDTFFGITSTSFNEDEFKRLGNERDRITNDYYELLKDLFVLLRNVRTDMFESFEIACKKTRGLTFNIGKKEKALSTASKSLADFESLCGIDLANVREDIASLDVRIDEPSITSTEKRRLHSKRAELMRKEADKVKHDRKFPSLEVIDAETDKRSSVIAALEATLATMRADLADSKVIASDSGLLRLQQMYKRMHFLKREYRTVTYAFLKVSPRAGNCLVRTYGYAPLQWWSDEHVASTPVVGHGIESVPVAEPHMLKANPSHLLAPGIASMQQTSIGMALGTALVSAICGESVPLALMGSVAPLALMNGSAHDAQNQLSLSGGASNVLAAHGQASNEWGITFAHGGFVPCDAAGNPIGRTASRLKSDVIAADNIRLREEALVPTVANFPVLGDNATETPAPSEVELDYLAAAMQDPTPAALAAAAELTTEHQREQRSWTLRVKKSKKGVRMNIDTSFTPRRDTVDCDDGTGDIVFYDDSDYTPNPRLQGRHRRDDDFEDM